METGLNLLGDWVNAYRERQNPQPTGFNGFDFSRKRAPAYLLELVHAMATTLEEILEEPITIKINSRRALRNGLNKACKCLPPSQSRIKRNERISSCKANFKLQKIILK